jgi:DNA topoisomerase VI B subunit
MYGQLTVGKPLHIISRTEGDELASELYVSIDTANNRPDIHKKRRVEWDRPHGTRVEMEMEGHHQTGPHSVEIYLKQTAIANPHVSITYIDPHGKETQFLRCTNNLPSRPKEIKPHPHGVELGRLIQMLSNTTSRSLLRFLVDEFSCVGKKTAIEIIKRAGKPLTDRSYPPTSPTRRPRHCIAPSKKHTSWPRGRIALSPSAKRNYSKAYARNWPRIFIQPPPGPPQPIAATRFKWKSEWRLAVPASPTLR